MSDIVDELRYWRRRMPAKWYGNADLDAAIAEIEALRTEIKELSKRDFIRSARRDSYM